jgi:hypothetical protein
MVYRGIGGATGPPSVRTPTMRSGQWQVTGCGPSSWSGLGLVPSTVDRFAEVSVMPRAATTAARVTRRYRPRRSTGTGNRSSRTRRYDSSRPIPNARPAVGTSTVAGHARISSGVGTRPDINAPKVVAPQLRRRQGRNGGCLPSWRLESNSARRGAEHPIRVTSVGRREASPRGSLRCIPRRFTILL